ncbi:TPA: hypothetical protein HA278_08630 [Candidatus Woesearchaeota archaeon]|nr:hypothetical protein [archaeon]HIJ12097.1 hypothetical protein [Candidatus Woesearchaeota archaeon]|tara:strand:+ start:411 stop:746 length:336 start_codon:yes stop_codon:yes gene_type:complete
MGIERLSISGSSLDETVTNVMTLLLGTEPNWIIISFSHDTAMAMAEEVCPLNRYGKYNPEDIFNVVAGTLNEKMREKYGISFHKGHCSAPTFTWRKTDKYVLRGKVGYGLG